MWSKSSQRHGPGVTEDVCSYTAIPSLFTTHFPAAENTESLKIPVPVPALRRISFTLKTSAFHLHWTACYEPIPGLQCTRKTLAGSPPEALPHAHHCARPRPARGAGLAPPKARTGAAGSGLGHFASEAITQDWRGAVFPCTAPKFSN